MKIHNYMKATINNLEQILKKKGNKLPNGAVTPMIQNYSPKLYVSQ